MKKMSNIFETLLKLGLEAFFLKNLRMNCQNAE
jgi:hypothetical protein